MSKVILVVEDEEKIMNVIKSFLESKEYIVIPTDNGRKAIELFEKENISMVLLDLMIPEIPEEEVCRLIRMKSRVPIIMLTAKTDVSDIIKGLELGADDYITKPFSLKLLYARMEAILRRSVVDLDIQNNKNIYNDGDLIVDIENHLVKTN